MNWLDRSIAWVAPGVGLRRAQARARTALLRGYDGAKKGRRTEGWEALDGSANAEIGPQLSALRARARELDRNNAWAKRAADVLVGAAVGTGILATPKGRSAKRLAETFAAWSRGCDVDGIHDFYGIQALAVRTMIVSGAALIRRWPRRSGLVPMQMQVIEPDYIDMSKTEPTSGGGWIRQGIEFNAQGQRVAYWLFEQHPGEADLVSSRLSFRSNRVPAEDIIHLFRPDRPGQVHGVPWAHSIMLPLRDMADYDEAEIVRKKIEACNVGVVTAIDGQQRPLAPATTDAETQARVESFEPGMFHHLQPGEDIRFNAPAASGGYADYMRVRQRLVATGFGVMYEHLTGDLSTVNYSSYRAGDLVFRAQIEALRWQNIIPNACDRMWRWFLHAATVAEVVPGGAGDAEVEWTPPRFQSIDAGKEAEADLLDIRLGTKTWDQAVAERGFDPEQQLAAIAARNGRFDALGVVLDCDPRQQARNGNRAGTAAAPADQPKG